MGYMSLNKKGIDLIKKNIEDAWDKVTPNKEIINIEIHEISLIGDGRFVYGAKIETKDI